MVEEWRILWDNIAKDNFKKIIVYIKRDSVQNAELVRSKVLKSISSIPKNPRRFPIDKYRKILNENFRAFEIYHIRISYFIGDNIIRIVRIRSTYQEPKLYE